MAPSSSYAPVNPDEDRLGVPHNGSSPESTSSARFTPDADSDDDDGEDVVAGLEDLEQEEGYEMKELGSRKGSRKPKDAGPSRHIDDQDSDDDDDLDHHTGERSTKHRRRSSTASFELHTPTEASRVRRKLDTHLVLFVALLYLLSFLDRSNIGNAKIAGLTKDLHLTDNMYEWLLTAFYITYICFEWMTVCYQLFRPHIYVSLCVAAWGVLASCQAVVSSWGALLALRALLGIGEAAFVGIPFYLTFFYRREELAVRVGTFISAAPLATSFASSLAYGIVSLGDKTGIASWRLLFLVEGFPAILVAVWAWHWIPDSPATARWLNARERKIAVLRLRNEGNNGSGESEKAGRTGQQRHKKKFQLSEVFRTLRDPKSYLTAAMFFCCNVAFSSMPVFLPTIIQSMGYSSKNSQALSAPPFLVAFLVVLLTAYLSDRFKTRSIPMIFHAILAASGYLTLTLAGAARLESHTLRYLAVYPICAGFFSAVTIVITWTVNNQASDEGKGTGMAVLNVIGQMGPLVGTRLYPDSDKPYFVTGMAVCCVAMCLVAVLALSLRFVLDRENAKSRARWKEAQEEGEGLVGGRSRGREFVYMI